ATMRITIETNQPLSESEVEILTLLLRKHPSPSTEQVTPATKKPAPAKKTPKPSKAQATPSAAPDEEPDEFASDEAGKETASKPEPVDDGDLESLLSQATEKAMELMNQGESDKVKAALAAAEAKKVSAIDNSADARRFLEALA